jgi:hypothetical protein
VVGGAIRRHDPAIRQSPIKQASRLPKATCSTRRMAGFGRHLRRPGSPRPGHEENLMPYPIKQIDGPDEEEVERLKSLGIRTTERLLEEAKSPKGRSRLAAKTGIDKTRILTWANAADRMRIKGMGKGYSCLLQAVGVDTVRELRYRNPENLAEAMADANKNRKLVEFLPSVKLVSRWVKQAQELTPKITYR